MKIFYKSTAKAQKATDSTYELLLIQSRLNLQKGLEAQRQGPKSYILRLNVSFQRVQSELYCLLTLYNILLTPHPPMANGPSTQLSWFLDPIPFQCWCVNFFKARNHCLLTLQSPPDIFPCFDLTRTVLQITFRQVTYLFITPAQTPLTLKF